MNKNIIIIGGGPAGLEAANQLYRLKYKPLLIEKSSYLGGHLNHWNRLFPDMASAKETLNELLDSVKDVTVMLNTDVQQINRLKDGYVVMLDNGISINASAVLVCTGFELFDAHKKEEYGYGIYDNVITNADLEAWMNGEADERIPENPRRIGFVHCVGSRDLKAGNSQCSKVCCMTAIKQAIEMKARFPESEIYCFYMDLRLFGKKYEDFYIKAQQEFGIHFIRGRVSEVSENIDGHLLVKAEDTLSGKPLKLTVDMLVLMAGMIHGKSTETLARMMRVPVDSDGFFQSKDNICNIIRSERPGIFYAGACTGTKTIPESIAEARSAALAVHEYLKNQ